MGRLVDEFEKAGIASAPTPFAGDNQSDQSAPAEAGETEQQPDPFVAIGADPVPEPAE
jgi:hypothetical protein